MQSAIDHTLHVYPYVTVTDARKQSERVGVRRKHWHWLNPAISIKAGHFGLPAFTSFFPNHTDVTQSGITP